MTFVERAHEYARAVVAGEIFACKWVALACRRQLADLERQTDEAWPFVFREDLAERACEFLEQLPHIQGPECFRRDDGSWNTLQLQPWQCFITCAVYGWVRKDSPPHRAIRRFTRVYEEEPRGQGKSLRLSGALLYAFAEGEQGVEAYSAAVDRDQASKVYGVARAMLEKRPDLAATLDLQMSAKAIYQTSTYSNATALSREAKKSGDGKNIAFAALDELHAHPTRDVYDVIDSGTGKRGGNALVWAITTAGFDLGGICMEKREYVTQVLEGKVRDEAWFGIIYTIVGEEKDAWQDRPCRESCADHSHPKCQWRAANPNWGVSVDVLDFESKMKRAVAVSSERNNMLTKHLCVWCGANVDWMDMERWDACANKGLTRATCIEQPMMMGLDLASTTDWAAATDLFHYDVPDGLDTKDQPKFKRHYNLFVQLFLPQRAVDESPNALLRGWVEDGWVTVTPGDVLDFDVVRETMRKRKAAGHIVREVAYDPWQAQDLANQMGAPGEGFTMVEIRPNVQNFSAPMKELAAAALTGRLHHDGNPAVRWMISNVVCHYDAKENIYPLKKRPEKKIDGAVSTFMALNRSMLAPKHVVDPHSVVTIAADGKPAIRGFRRL